MPKNNSMCSLYDTDVLHACGTVTASQWWNTYFFTGIHGVFSTNNILCNMNKEDILCHINYLYESTKTKVYRVNHRVWWLNMNVGEKIQDNRTVQLINLIKQLMLSLLLTEKKGKEKKVREFFPTTAHNNSDSSNSNVLLGSCFQKQDKSYKITGK